MEGSEPADEMIMPQPPLLRDDRKESVRPWIMERGANVISDGGVRFAVWAPSAGSVAVRLHKEGRTTDYQLELDGKDMNMGVYAGEVKDAAAGDDYQYLLDGGMPLPDPASRWQPSGVHGPSRIVDPALHRWHDKEWGGREMADMVIYEFHVGTFTEAGTFHAAIEHLGALRSLGVTAIELMPVAEFPGARNWGYDGVDLYAPQSTYGGPDGLRALVDAAHSHGLAVVLDVVYNHLGPEGNYLRQFGPYFTDRYHTPWGDAVNYDGADSPGVRRLVTDNALYWITEFHVDALRLDAVHGIFDFGAVHILAEIASSVHRQGRLIGRRTLVIAESDLNDPRLLRPESQGGYGLDAQWSDDFHHAVHSALTGERSGYYADFGGVTPVGTALSDRFVYAGQYSPFRRRHHGAPATDISGDKFVVSIQNHDQVGNRANGDRLATLVDFDRLKVAAVLLLTAPNVPMLFMGEEYGETRPFLYFVSHGDEKLVKAVREGRSAEFASFGWGADVPDPQSPETFARSRLDRGKARGGTHAALLRLYKYLLQLRASEPALTPGNSLPGVQHSGSEGWVTLLLTPSAGNEIAALFNLSSRQVRVPLPGASGRSWVRLIATGDARYSVPSRQAEPSAAPSAESTAFPDRGDARFGDARFVEMTSCSAVLFKREVAQ